MCDVQSWLQIFASFCGFGGKELRELQENARTGQIVHLLDSSQSIVSASRRVLVAILPDVRDHVRVHVQHTLASAVH